MILRAAQSVLWELILLLIWIFNAMVGQSIVNHLRIVVGLHIAFWICLIINVVCLKYIQAFNNNDNLVSVKRLLIELKKHLKLYLC